MVCTTKPTFLKVSMLRDTLLEEKERGLSSLLVTKLLEEMGLLSPLVTNSSRTSRELLIAPSSNDI